MTAESREGKRKEKASRYIFCRVADQLRGCTSFPMAETHRNILPAWSWHGRSPFIMLAKKNIKKRDEKCELERNDEGDVSDLITKRKGGGR